VLAAYGDDVGLVMTDGRKFDCPKRFCMLYDGTGEYWPKDSLLVASIKRGRRRASDQEYKGDPKHWLGRNYEAHVGSFDRPPRSLSEWKRVAGTARKIFYDRFGDRAPGQFKHTFNTARGLYRIVALFRGERDVIVYRRGRTYRIDLGAGSIVSDLGIVWP